MMVRSKPLLSTLTLALWLVSALTAIAADGAPASPVGRVLVVYQNESTLTAAMEIAKGLRNGLDVRLPMRFELYSEYLDTVRFPSPDHLSRLGADLAAKYADIHLDIVMAVGPGALQFMLDNRARIGAG